MATRRLTDDERNAVNKRAADTYDIRRTLRFVEPKLSPEQIEQYAQEYERNAAAPASAAKTNVVKHEERVMSENKIVVKNLAELAEVLKQGAIEKKMQVFMLGPDGLMPVDLDAAEDLLERMAGTGTEEVFSTMPTASAARFPSSASIVDRPVREDDDSVTPLKPYDVTYPGITRVGPFAVLNPNMDPGIARPAPFDPSEPKDRHDADHADVNAAKFTEEGWLGGLKSVTKSSPTLKSGAVKPGTFRNAATNLNVRQDHEA